MGFFSKLFGFEKNTPSRPLPISSVLADNHPAVTLYELTRQCFTKEDAILVQCAKDIVREAEQQYKIGDQFRDKINTFFLNNPGYQQRIKTHIVKFEDNLYALGFILEIICISRSNLARKMLIESNFIYRNRAGDLTYLPLIDYDQIQLREFSFAKKEQLLFDVIYKLENDLEDVDFRFIKHVENVLSEINGYYSDICNEFVGFDCFDNNKSQYPAITCHIDKNEMIYNYRYNYSNELKNTYTCYFKDDQTYHLRISFVLETLDYYIEMCTRYKLYMVVSWGYYKVYTRKYDFLSGRNFRSIIKESKGDMHAEAIDKCINTMCKFGN